MTAFGNFGPKISETNLNFRNQGVRNKKKNKDTIAILTFKIDITDEPVFFSNFLLFGA